MRENRSWSKFYLCKVNKFFLFHQVDLALFFFSLECFFFGGGGVLPTGSHAASLQRQVNCLHVQSIEDNIDIYIKNTIKINIMQIE